MKGRRTLDMFGFFLKSYPMHSFLMVLCLLFAGLLEGMSLAMFLPLLDVMAGPESSAGTPFAQVVDSVLGRVGLEPTLPVLLTIIVLGITLKGGFVWLAMRQVGYTIAGVAADLRMRLIGALLKARWGYFASRPVGHFANAIAAEAQIASATYKNMAIGMSFIIQFLVYLVTAFLVSWQTALLGIGAGVFIMLLVFRLVGKSRLAGRKNTGLRKQLLACLVDALHGIKPVKAMAREPHLLPLLEAETQGMNQAQRQRVIATQTVTALQEPIAVVILAVGLYVVMTYVDIPFASLLMLAFLFSRLVNQMNQVLRYYQAVAVGESAFWSIYKEIDDAENAAEPPSGDRRLDHLKQGLTLQQVDYAYGENPPVLRGVDMDIPAGSFVAVIGASGAGKTTLVDLLVGLYRPNRGRILVDGVDLNEFDVHAWRRRIGYVPQEMFLFHDSIYRNVTLGDNSISRERVKEVLQAAGAWGFVESLPEGMDALVGERGSKLSGGQRQRIAIARALAAKPSLLILDEVTTSLDPDTEQAICETLRTLKGQVTILAISHQAALRAAAERVYKLEKGVLVSPE